MPLGGALFALEVLLGTLALPLIPPALAVSTVAAGVSWLFLPMRPTYDIPFYSTSASLVAWALLFGPFAGLASVGYVRLICWADALKPRRTFWLLATPVIVFVALGALAAPLPQLLGNCKGLVQLAFNGELTPLLVLFIAALRPLATAASLGSGAPGGLLTPTLAFGAVLGALCAQGWLLVWPDAAAGLTQSLGPLLFWRHRRKDRSRPSCSFLN